MAQIISFFSKQTILSSVPDFLYSEVFEVTGGPNFAAQLRVLTGNGVNVTGVIEGCMDPRITPTSVWYQLGTDMVVTTTPGNGHQNFTKLPRFMRAKIKGEADFVYIVSFDGILRSTS